MFIQAQIGDQSLELSVLIFQLLESSQLANAQPPIQLLSEVKCLLGYPHPTQHLCVRCPGLHLFQRVGNLLICKSTLLHDTFLPSKSHDARKISVKPEEKIGRTSAGSGKSFLNA
jgi:hypothetical protein